MSDEVVDILEAVGLQKPNIAILSDEFLEHIRGLNQKNLAVELLLRLLLGKVKAVSRTNVILSKKFSKMLEEAVIK
jgi:type I restriction enzyme R subunit